MGFPTDTIPERYGNGRSGFAIPREGALLYFTVIAVSTLVAFALVATYGNIEASAALVVALVIVFLSFYRVDLAFFLFIGMVLLFDQFLVVPGKDPITDAVGYFYNLKQMPFLPPISVGVMNPIEIQLCLMLLGLFLAVSARRTTSLQHVPNWGLALLFTFAMIFSLGYGLVRGGIFLRSLWEVRALFYFLLLYFLVPQIIQTRDHLNVLMWIFIVMIGIKDLQGAVRFASLGFSFKGNLCLTNHEDPVFTVDLWMFLIGLLALGVRSKHRTTILLLLPVLILGFYSGKRRAAYAAFMVSVIVFTLMLNKKERRAFYRYLIPSLIIAVCYSAMFWNSSSKLASPVRMVKSGLIENKKVDGSHYTSNLYREIERFDLAATIQTAPVIGIGFGNKYAQPIPLVRIGFPLQDWIPHDEILWVMTKMGAVGFFIFFIFIDTILFETVSLSRKLKDPYLRAWCFMIAVSIVNQVVVSYLDLQLTYYRDMIFLGTLCGLLTTLKKLDNKESPERAPLAPERVPSEQMA